MFFFVLLFFAFLTTFVSSCPDDPMPPCTCRVIGNHACIITCMNAQNEIDLIKSLRSMTAATVPIKSVEIFGASIYYLPSDAFKGLSFSKLSIIDSEMVALSDTEEAFKGLEDSLETLIVQECLLQSGWRWEHLRNMRALTELHTMRAGLDAIDKDVKEIAHLDIKNLFFTKDQISYIDDTAFVTFHNLITLSLKQNEIDTLKRSMFPNPALKLEHLILSHNKFKSLPKDLFTNMPKLDSIILSNNELFTIDESVFKQVWGQLIKMDVSDNPLKCDCRMKWLVKFSFPKNTWGKCNQPKTLKGKEVRSLVEGDLWC